MAIKAFNSIGGFSVGESADNIILANGDITTSNANLSANLFVTDTANVGNLRTDNLLYANGQPWDLQEAAGGNTQIQYNDGNNNFGASANFTFDQTTNLLTVTGNINSSNANLGNIVVANFFHGVFDSTSSNQSNITTVGNLTSLQVVGNINGGNLITTGLANIGNLSISGSITGNLTSVGNGTADLGSSSYRWKDLYLGGNVTSLNADLGNLVTGNFVNVSSNLNVTDTANVGNLRTDNLLHANGTPWDFANPAGSNTQVQFNDGNGDFGASANFTFNTSTQVLAVTGNVTVTDTANVGNLRTDNLLHANGDAWDFANPAGSNTQIQYNDGNGNFGASANFTFNESTQVLTVTGNISGSNILTGGAVTATGNGTFGNLSTTGSGGNITGANVITANTFTATANISGNNVSVTTLLTASGTANVGNLNISGISNLGPVANVIITGGTDGYVLQTDGTGNLSWVAVNSSSINNGNSNVSIPTADGNINLTSAGNTTMVITGTGVNVAGTLNATGNITGNYYFGNGSQLTGISADSSNQLANGTSNVTIPTANGPIIFGANGVANVVNVSDTGTVIQNLLTVADGNITTESNANLVLDPNGTGVVVIANTSGGATAIQLGDPTQGNLVSNAVTLANSSSVSNAIAQLNTVLGKLVPPSPPNFPTGTTIAIQSVSTYRMTNYTQTDNTPGGGKSVAGGTSVARVRRASSYTTNAVANVGPGDSGTILVSLNGANAGSRTLTGSLNGNGTYSNLIITNNFDYRNVNANIQAGFWSVFTSQASGTVTEGWNEVYISDSATTNTNTANWFYDSSAPGTPVFSSLTITPPGSPSYTYSSTIPNYNNTNQFTLTADVNKLSGNMYPTTDTFITGTAGGAFAAPSSVTYSAAGVTTPLAQNLYVSSGNASISTTSTIIAGFGSSSTGPSLSADNSYNVGTAAYTATLGANVLYKTGTASSATVIEEANVYVGSTIGSGSGLAFRIINPGSGNTPAYTGSEAAFNSQSSTLQTYDATVSSNILKHDQTNYATGYLPAGPNLSSGRSGTQYFTIKIIRTSVSKFDIKWSGTIAGLWVALPGSAIDTSSTLNGWLDLSVAYAGAGQPGAGTGGNGSNGASLGGVAPLNSAQTNKSITATFGTISSSSTSTNEIYIRIALTSGQSVTALSLQTASN